MYWLSADLIQMSGCRENHGLITPAAHVPRSGRTFGDVRQVARWKTSRLSSPRPWDLAVANIAATARLDPLMSVWEVLAAEALFHRGCWQARNPANVEHAILSLVRLPLSQSWNYSLLRLPALGKNRVSLSV